MLATAPTPSEGDGRLSPVEGALLGILIVVPALLAWRFASPSFFFHDDFINFYYAHGGGWNLDYIFGSANGHLTPGLKVAYLALDPISQSDYDIALVVTIACQTASAVLIQRILQICFGRVWWTYALAFAWAISVIYLATVVFFSSAMLTLASITATLASIHGHLAWRQTGKRAWLVWSVVAMGLALCFYIKGLLIPVYLVLMRVLLLEQDKPLGDSIRETAREWRVWIAYAAVGVAYLLVYFLGDYQRSKTGYTVGDVIHYAEVFWVDGFWPMVFGVRVRPFEHLDWHQVAIVATQLVLAGLVALSIARRRIAWRAWAFLLAVIGVNLLIVVGRVAEFGSDAIGYYVRYYSEAAVFVPIAFAFAFAVPGSRESGFRLPDRRALALALATLAAYGGLTLATSESMTKPTSVEPFSGDLDNARLSGRPSREYFENLQSGLDELRASGRPFSLLDQDVPEVVMSSFFNLQGLEEGVRYTRLSVLLPLFDERVGYNDPTVPIHAVDSEGVVRPTRFVRWAGGTVPRMRREGGLRTYGGELRRVGPEYCLRAGGRGAALELIPGEPLEGKNAWLRADYSSSGTAPVDLESNIGPQWIDEPNDLPAEGGGALIPLSPPFYGAPLNAGVRLVLPPRDELCLGSLEIGSFDAPSSGAVGGAGSGPTGAL